MHGWKEAFRAPRARGSGGGAVGIGDTFTVPAVKDAGERAIGVATKAFEVPSEEEAETGDVPEVSKVS